MKQAKLQVYDPPMCCSSGVCGPNVNPELVRFSADLDWLKKEGVEVERFNLSSHPSVFANNDIVKKILSEKGNSCLPLILVDGVIVKDGSYPTRTELAKFVGIKAEEGNTEKSEVNPPCCGPGCNCGSTPSGSMTKITIGLLILLIACGVLAYKIIIAPPASKTVEKSGFAVSAAKADALPAQVPQASVPVTATVSQVSMSTSVAADSEKVAEQSKVTEEKAYLGELLASLKELNTVAISQDAVFILVPGNDKLVKAETDKAVQGAQQALKKNGITVGLYTLTLTSPDYLTISSKVSTPAILVVCKGRGMGAVSGDVTETKLLQAYMASSQSGGGCGPATSGCGPSGCK